MLSPRDMPPGKPAWQAESLRYGRMRSGLFCDGGGVGIGEQGGGVDDIEILPGDAMRPAVDAPVGAVGRVGIAPAGIGVGGDFDGQAVVGEDHAVALERPDEALDLGRKGVAGLLVFMAGGAVEGGLEAPAGAHGGQGGGVAVAGVVAGGPDVGVLSLVDGE